MDADQDLTTLRRQARDLLARIEALEARSAPPALTPALPPPARVGRRRALVGLAGAAAAGAVASVAGASPASAADGDPLLVGSPSNSATYPTELVYSGPGSSSSFHVLKASDSPGLTPLVDGALVGTASRVLDAGVVGQGAGQSYGVYAQAGAGTALQAVCADGKGLGVLSHGHTGLSVTNGSDEGVVAVLDGRRQLHLLPNGLPAPTADGVADDGVAGELRWSGPEAGGGALWACTRSATSGQPAEWQVVAGGDAAPSFHLLPAPVRAYDSRPGSVPATGPKAPLPGSYGPRPVSLAEAVPAGATGALLTVQLVNANVGNGNLTVWAGGQPRPQATTMVWGGDARRFSTMAVSAVDAERRVQAAASIPTDLVVDVVGYYR